MSHHAVLTQTFVNEASDHLKNMVYSFPMYAGVSVVDLTATIGEVTIKGTVKEKRQARKEFKDAVAKGESAALLEQLPEASDVFTTTIGNVPTGASVVVDIVYIGELSYDAQADGIRFTIPNRTPLSLLTGLLLLPQSLFSTKLYFSQLSQMEPRGNRTPTSLLDVTW
ncbi:vault protein inter-alpha-trypsin domain-containing protein [Xylariaceae sp. FL0255]|nr:vault protein inter-alpha-trypsin domain-containing protein [Xylariaceae sp. FL0255]